MHPFVLLGHKPKKCPPAEGDSGSVRETTALWTAWWRLGTRLPTRASTACLGFGETHDPQPEGRAPCWWWDFSCLRGRNSSKPFSSCGLPGLNPCGPRCIYTHHIEECLFFYLFFGVTAMDRQTDRWHSHALTGAMIHVVRL